MTPYGALRTHGAGTLRASDDGTAVVLAGWVARRRDHGGVAFLDLRDRSGVVQVVADPESDAALRAAHDVRSEYVVAVRGTVRRRPDGMVNPRLETGEVEVAASSLEILSVADTPPFPIDDRVEVDESMRLRYRYLDMRRSPVAAAVRLRSETTRIIREVMDAHGFVDVETPLLTRSTPEGARDFLVPSRLRPGEFYALPQSPQLFKQLLMVAGVERYYQIARCFRDEDFRADRQPEFTQLDVEASFIDEEDVIALVEELMQTLWLRLLDVKITTPFRRMPYAEAMARFGSDKPDLRFGMELATLDDVFRGTGVGVFAGALEAGGTVVAVRLPGGGDLTRKQFDGWVDFARSRGAKGLAWAVVNDDGTLRSPLAKFMSEPETAALLEATEAQAGDAIFFGAGPVRATQQLMGALRVELARAGGMVAADRWEFLWITAPPVFEWSADEQRWDAVHHPFTAPTDEGLARLEEAPGEVRARAYDLVLNGLELGGGSIRINRADVHRRVFALLGFDEDEARERFGFLLDAFTYGAPPHGGIAFGLDRLVMMLAGEDSIRDVIPFPKTQTGADVMTGAPSAIDEPQLRALGLRTRSRG
ncbi:MAG TPA: aspartate--tRNA ligase [Euzebyales bacterium]|nr:aspartate--tRNA ligase [Euzebyales bacterium]